MIGRTGVFFPKIILARTGIATMLPTRWTARRNGAFFVMLGAGVHDRGDRETQALRINADLNSSWADGPRARVKEIGGGRRDDTNRLGGRLVD
jgi:hypothetical protein